MVWGTLGPWGVTREACMMAQWGPAEFLITKCSEDRRWEAEDRNTILWDPCQHPQWQGVREHPYHSQNYSGRSRSSEAGEGSPGPWASSSCVHAPPGGREELPLAGWRTRGGVGARLVVPSGVTAGAQLV